MLNLPEIRKKARKASYRKSEAIKLLEQLATEEARQKHPNIDPVYLAPRLFRDDTANSLTASIVKYIALKGGFASRVNNAGVYNQKLGKYLPATSRKGLPDILATYHGKSLFIEVKIGRDRMSDYQEKVKADQERSGGLYFIAHNFTEFKLWFDQL